MCTVFIFINVLKPTNTDFYLHDLCDGDGMLIRGGSKRDGLVDIGDCCRLPAVRAGADHCGPAAHRGGLDYGINYNMQCQ